MRFSSILLPSYSAASLRRKWAMPAFLHATICINDNNAEGKRGQEDAHLFREAFLATVSSSGDLGLPRVPATAPSLACPPPAHLDSGSSRFSSPCPGITRCRLVTARRRNTGCRLGTIRRRGLTAGVAALVAASASLASLGFFLADFFSL